MTDVRRLGQIILARIAAEVPVLDGRVNDWSTEGTAYPNVTLDAIYGVENDAECIEADEWTIQFSVWDQNTSKLKHTELGQKVRYAIKGWSNTDEVTMHPLSVPPPTVSLDVDGKTMRARLMVEAMVERD